MLIKINNKPIEVKEDEEKDFSWVYMGVSSLGFMSCLWVVDYAASIFVGTSPFGLVLLVNKIIHGIGVFLSWF